MVQPRNSLGGKAHLSQALDPILSLFGRLMLRYVLMVLRKVRLENLVAKLCLEFAFEGFLKKFFVLLALFFEALIHKMLFSGGLLGVMRFAI